MNKQSLGEALWKTVHELNDSRDIAPFRDYMMSFLLLFYLSDNYEKAAYKSLRPNSLSTTKNDQCSSLLSTWYDKNTEDIRLFERQMRARLHYVIKPEHLWTSIAEMAKKRDENLLDTLQKSFANIEEESRNTSLRKIFSEINLNSQKFGNRHEDRNDKLCLIIQKIDESIAKFPTDRNSLGDACEYLLGKFVLYGGVNPEEFYTAHQISTILSRIVTLNTQCPSTGKRNRLNRVLDFACGSGSLLLNVRNQMGKGDIGKLYGQEMNAKICNLARMNMLLHGVEDAQFDIFHGDSLRNDWDILNEMDSAEKLQFDAVIASPSFGYTWNPKKDPDKDIRFKNYGRVPKYCVDFAFLLHGLHFLNDDGVMAIILSYGVLFRDGAEAHIRKKLVQYGYVDTVIGLPGNLFLSSGVPVCVLVLKKNRKSKDILFINASSEENFERRIRQNRLRNEDVDKIVETYQYRKEEERYSRCVSVKEIAENDYNLRISRYINTVSSRLNIDMMELDKELLSMEKNQLSTAIRFNLFLGDLGLPTIPLSNTGNGQIPEVSAKISPYT